MAKKEKTTLELKEDALYFPFGKSCKPLTNEMLQDADVVEFIESKLTDEERSGFFK